MKEYRKGSWEDKLRHRLNSLEENPDDKLWAGIEENIRPARYRYFSLVAAILLLLVLGVGLYHFTVRERVQDDTVLVEREISEGNEKGKKQPVGGVMNGEDSAASNSLQRNRKPSEVKEVPEPYSSKETEFHNEKGKDSSGGKNDKYSAGKAGFTPTLASIPEKRSDDHDQLRGERKGEAVKGVSDKEKISIKRNIAFLPIINRKEAVLDHHRDYYHYQIQELQRETVEAGAPPEEEKLSATETVKTEGHSKRNLNVEVWTAINPMLIYRQVAPNQEDDIQIVQLENVSPLSINRMGMQSSAGVSVFVTSKLAVKGGAFYRLSRNKWSYSYIPANPDSVVVSFQEGEGMDVEPFFSPKVQTFEDYNNELGLLIGLQYSAGSMLRRSFHVELQGAKDLKSGLFKYYLSFSAEVERQIGKRTFLYAGPSFMWGLNNSSPGSNENFAVKPYSLGVKIGMAYRIRK